MNITGPPKEGVQVRLSVRIRLLGHLSCPLSAEGNSGIIFTVALRPSLPSSLDFSELLKCQQ